MTEAATNAPGLKVTARVVVEHKGIAYVMGPAPKASVAVNLEADALNVTTAADLFRSADLVLGANNQVLKPTPPPPTANVPAALALVKERHNVEGSDAALDLFNLLTAIHKALDPATPDQGGPKPL